MMPVIRQKVLKSAAITVMILSFTTVGCGDFSNSDNKSSNKTKVNNPSQNPTNPNKPIDSANLPAEFRDLNTGDVTEKKIFANLAVNVFAKQAESLNKQVDVFTTGLETYCQALKSNQEATTEAEDAKRDWQRLMNAFHQLEGAPFGPIVADGRFISDYLYSWPFLNTCGIDQNVIAFGAQEVINPLSLMFNQRGLAAVEYLLFENSLLSKCNVRANPAVKVWNELPAKNRQLQRCQWAQQLVPDIKAKAKLLSEKWELSQDSFSVKLVKGELFENDKEALNALTDALSNIEKLKDLKLGRPLGKHKDCSAEICPGDVEHIYSGASLASAEAQLRGFKTVFFGSNDPAEKAFSVDDILIKQGRADVVNRMAVAVEKAIQSVREVQKNGDLKSQIEAMDLNKCRLSTTTDRLVPICAVHSDIREVAAILKTEVLVALSLRAPPTHQGDND
ncbi:MAG: imelysin family protein [Bdellovibrionia bacterium]